jgi:hypothetical protein
LRVVWPLPLYPESRAGQDRANPRGLIANPPTISVAYPSLQCATGELPDISADSFTAEEEAEKN